MQTHVLVTTRIPSLLARTCLRDSSGHELVAGAQNATPQLYADRQ